MQSMTQGIRRYHPLELRSFGDRHLGALPHDSIQAGIFSRRPLRVYDTDRPISSLLKVCEGSAALHPKWVKPGQTTLNIRIVRGLRRIVGVGFTIRRLHPLVPGGGIAPDGQSWIAGHPGFFLPVQVLSRMFRGLFLRYLEKAFAAGELNFFAAHRHLHEPAAFRRYLAPAWTVDFQGLLLSQVGGLREAAVQAGPAQVLDYVGRHTHRVSPYISNNRLVSMNRTTARSASAGRIIGMTIARRR